jgi:hypothetical protein
VPAPPVAAAAAAPAPNRAVKDDPGTLSPQRPPAAKEKEVAKGLDADVAALSASGVSVPVEMVSQIAQRVVAQISEKVIREVAWEVIPELAEVLIKKEIERLKAELQST